MAESSIPVDLTNPGQVFACLGLMELADTLLGDAAGAFEWGGAHVAFRLSAAGDEAPVGRALAFLEEVLEKEEGVVVRMPAGYADAKNWRKERGTLRADPPDAPFPFRRSKPVALPVALQDRAGNRVDVDYWGDSTSRDNVRLWPGSSGYPGAAILINALNSVRGRMCQHSDDPFGLSEKQSSGLGFDWRRDYMPVDVGFSPNEHKSMVMAGFPLVEVLAAIGVTNARPARIHRFRYRYGVIGSRDERPLDPILLRAALGGEPPAPGMPFRRFVMHLDRPGQRSAARCIVHVTEEETHQ